MEVLKTLYRIFNGQLPVMMLVSCCGHDVCTMPLALYAQVNERSLACFRVHIVQAPRSSTMVLSEARVLTAVGHTRRPRLFYGNNARAQARIWFVASTSYKLLRNKQTCQLVCAACATWPW